jgi:hypothetical protein
LLEDPVTGEVPGFYHRTCIAGAEKLASGSFVMDIAI